MIVERIREESTDGVRIKTFHDPGGNPQQFICHGEMHIQYSGGFPRSFTGYKCDECGFIIEWVWGAPADVRAARLRRT